jgi:hypothetical protein
MERYHQQKVQRIIIMKDYRLILDFKLTREVQLVDLADVLSIVSKDFMKLTNIKLLDFSDKDKEGLPANKTRTLKNLIKQNNA